VPGGAEATICVPYEGGQSVKLGGSVIYENGAFSGADGIEFAGIDDGFAVFTVKSAADSSLSFEVN